MAQTKARLSSDEIAAYRRDGFITPRFRLAGSELVAVQALAKQLVADNPHLQDQPLACPHVPNSGVQKLKTTDEWMHVSTHPAILDMLEQVVGPDLILWGSNLFHKRAKAGPAVPWHRDATYWPIKPLATTSVWIAITDSVIENGCLRCIPGSHASRELGRHFHSRGPEFMIPGTLGEEEYDESQARDVELEAGQMVIFDAFVIHGSQPNRGTRDRTGYSLRFMPSTSHYDHDASVHLDEPGAGHHTRPLILVRGVNRCPQNDLSRGHPKVPA